MQNKDSLEVKIDHIISGLQEIKSDLKEAKNSLSQEVVTLKIQQERCNSHWSLIGKSLSRGGIFGMISYIIISMFPSKPLN